MENVKIYRYKLDEFIPYSAAGAVLTLGLLYLTSRIHYVHFVFTAFSFAIFFFLRHFINKDEIRFFDNGFELFSPLKGRRVPLVLFNDISEVFEVDGRYGLQLRISIKEGPFYLIPAQGLSLDDFYDLYEHIEFKIGQKRRSLNREEFNQNFKNSKKIWISLIIAFTTPFLVINLLSSQNVVSKVSCFFFMIVEIINAYHWLYLPKNRVFERAFEIQKDFSYKDQRKLKTKFNRAFLILLVTLILIGISLFIFISPFLSGAKSANWILIYLLTIIFSFGAVRLLPEDYYLIPQFNKTLLFLFVMMFLLSLSYMTLPLITSFG